MTNIYLLAQINVGTIQGPAGPLTGVDPNNAGLTFASVLSTAVAIMTIIAGIYFLFLIIIGGIGIMGAGGDPNKVAEARNKITGGLTGFIVVAVATVLISLIGWILGIDTPLGIAAWIPAIAL